MYKWMQKNNRKLLAVFAVGLMIAFVIPQFGQKNLTPSEVELGSIGTQKITAADIQHARNEWGFLRSQVFIPARQPGQQPIPVAAFIFGSAAFEQIERHDKMFYLLKKEAEQMGVSVSQSELAAFLAEVNVRLADGRLVLVENLGNDNELADAVKQSLASLLLVKNAFDRGTSVSKISTPVLNQQMARNAQEIKLQLIDFASADFVEKVAAPDAAALKKHFDEFADKFSQDPDRKANPFGFGYRYPDRVKFQSIGISRDELRKAVRASKTDYDWEVEAQRYYKKNSHEFPTTAPTSRPTTTPTDAFSLGSGGPTTRPFAEVKDEAIDKVINPLADKLGQQVQTRIAAILGADWNNYRAELKKLNGPSTAPATLLSSYGVPYDSVEYLQKLADDIAKQFKVVPVVSSMGERFLSEEDLGKLPGIGRAYTFIQLSDRLRSEIPALSRIQPFGNQSLVPFPLYATQLAAPLMDAKLAEETGEGLALFEPSRPVDSMDGTTYIFRLTAAEKSHKPADMNEMATTVEVDLRNKLAFDAATDSANKALEVARGGGIRAAAASTGKIAVETGWIRGSTQIPFTGYTVSANSMPDFIDGAFKLLAVAAKDSSKPVVGLIALPRDGKVVVAQLADVRSDLTPEQMFEESTLLSRQIAQQLQGAMYGQWFAYDNVVNRTGFKDVMATTNSAE